MRLLLDTNVLLDVLLDRHPWVEASSAVWKAHEDDRITCYVAACTLADIFYVARKLTNLETARRAIGLCCETFEICPVDRRVLETAHVMPGSDLEDNLQIACAGFGDLDAIVTRDGTGFEASPLPVFSPSELLEQWTTG